MSQTWGRRDRENCGQGIIYEGRSKIFAILKNKLKTECNFSGNDLGDLSLNGFSSIGFFLLMKCCVCCYKRMPCLSKGWVFSLCRELLIQTMEACGFQHQEFLLSPSSVGVTTANL